MCKIYFKKEAKYFEIYKNLMKIFPSSIKHKINLRTCDDVMFYVFRVFWDFGIYDPFYVL